MRNDTLWAVLIEKGGRELARIPLAAPASRETLPLRELTRLGLCYDAAALVILRQASDQRCTPCAAEQSAIETARQTLNAIELRLHDYILWHSGRCISLRSTGRL